MTFFSFLVKKFIGRLVLPLGQVLVLWLAGALVWWRRPARRTGPLLMIMAGLWLLVLSMPITGLGLMHGLEAQNWSYASPDALRDQGVRDIVVLAGGYGQGDTTAADCLAPASLKRLLEGVRLWRQMPGAKLVLSGGDFYGELSEGQAMAALALELGVPREAIILEDASWDTEDQARLLKKRLDHKPFALVTSALHMPRSLAWFRSYGLNSIPAPGDFRTKDIRLDLFSLLPSASGLKNCEDAIHEYLGLAWQWLKLALGGAPKEATS
ncbi:MAG: YdcF family protein [Deltaproteobacteria bacterium]|nr:YdcF family protein [Deltaproteobacteria bacterium]